MLVDCSMEQLLKSLTLSRRIRSYWSCFMSKKFIKFRNEIEAIKKTRQNNFDSFEFFHNVLRIKIETRCRCSKLSHDSSLIRCWILRKQKMKNDSLKKLKKFPKKFKCCRTFVVTNESLEDILGVTLKHNIVYESLSVSMLSEINSRARDDPFPLI